MYEAFLELIANGSISLLHAPPLNNQPRDDADFTSGWVGWQCRVARLDARGVLEESMRVANEQFANVSTSDLPLAIEKMIAQDLLRMQQQPVFMDEYRRYVVIKSTKDEHFKEAPGGVSSSPLSCVPCCPLTYSG